MLAWGLLGSIGGDVKSSSSSPSPSYWALNSASKGLSSAALALGERAPGEIVFRG